MQRRWLPRIVYRSLTYRGGRSLLLIAVLAMASSLVTALGIVSASIGDRVAEELRQYGANLVIMPEAARIDVGSGGLNFGIITEPSYLDEAAVEGALAGTAVRTAARSSHLRGTLLRQDTLVPVEGVNFAEVRRLFPWWRLQGGWPTAGGAVAGSDLAARLGIRPGDTVDLDGPSGRVTVRVDGIVATGGEEDRLLYLDLRTLQESLGLPGRVTLVRLMVDAGAGVGKTAARLQAGLPGGTVREVRQVARTSEGLLRKVQILMLVVTAVVVVAAGASVAGTMGTTIVERGREIGLLKAMGGTRRGVLLLFATEAATLGIIGGLAGFLAGWGLAAVAAKTVFGAASGFMPGFIPLSLLAALGLALVGSLGPLIAVFRLDPSTSLRGE